MSDSTREETVFGKDLGLVHQVVCIGREQEIGANRDFWSYLAYDRKIFAEVVKIVMTARTNWLTLSQDELNEVQKWVARLENNDCPYPEDETYYTRSSHSEYDNRIHHLHHGGRFSGGEKGFSEIFRKASQSKDVARVAMLIEETFVISYLLSGFYSAEQDPEGTNKKWMHGPFSILTYFEDIWDDDPRVSTGSFFGTAELKAIPDLKKIHDMCDRNADDKSVKPKVGKIVVQLRTIKAQVITSLKLELTKFVKE
ncbi:MAG: hypothetical protein WC827_04265 [Candidatus Paceibacterota bacterium]|jgi:hypothetical protein